MGKQMGAAHPARHAQRNHVHSGRRRHGTREGHSDRLATILVTQDLPAGEYTLEHTLVDGVGPFCELKSTDGRIDLFSSGTVKATLPAGDYRMLVSVSPGKTVDATITPILRKLN